MSREKKGGGFVTKNSRHPGFGLRLLGEMRKRGILQRSLSALTIIIKMCSDTLSPPVCGLCDGEAAFEQVAVFVFGRGVRLGLVLLPKPQLGDGAAQAGIVAEDAEMALVERLQDGAAECVLEVV